MISHPRLTIGAIITMPSSRLALLRYGFSSASLLSASIGQLAIFAILARALGPAEFGQFVQITALTAIAIQLCGLGAGDCFMRRVSRDPAAYRDMLGHNLILIVATGAILVGLGVPAIFYVLHAWMGNNISLLSNYASACQQHYPDSLRPHC